jgi:hypothetical protein
MLQAAALTVFINAQKSSARDTLMMTAFMGALSCDLDFG